MHNNFIKYLLLLCFAFAYVRLLIPYIGFFARFMFNEATNWNKYIEKPRMVFYGIGLLLMHSSYSSILEYQSQSTGFFFISNFLIFLGGILMSQITWSKKFKSIFIPSIQKKLRSRRNFDVSISERQLQKLYDELVRFDMIDIERTGNEDFEKVFLLNWDTHSSKIYFNLDAPSCREFYELFRIEFPKNALSLIDFFDRSNAIRRTDGSAYAYDTIRNAKSRTPISKRSDDLKVIFSNL